MWHCGIPPGAGHPWQKRVHVCKNWVPCSIIPFTLPSVPRSLPSAPPGELFAASTVHVSCHTRCSLGLWTAGPMPLPPLHDASQGHGAVHTAIEPVAIVGLSLEVSGGCDTTESFWQALLDRRNTATEPPPDRYSAESIWHPDASRRGTVGFRGGHFVTRDIGRFDAPFFSISDTEAAALDPQQRGLLEATFRALENGTFFSELLHVFACMLIYRTSGSDAG